MPSTVYVMGEEELSTAVTILKEVHIKSICYILSHQVFALKSFLWCLWHNYNFMIKRFLFHSIKIPVRMFILILDAYFLIFLDWRVDNVDVDCKSRRNQQHKKAAARGWQQRYPGRNT